MAKVKLTNTAKIFIAVVIVGVAALVIKLNPEWLGKVAPQASNAPTSNIPPSVSLPGDSSAAPQLSAVAEQPPGCPKEPEVRFYHWAWNAQMGMMYATGGKQAVANSLMCQKGVNL